MSTKLTPEQVEQTVYNNTLHTCHYVSGYTNRRGSVRIKCEKHNLEFETSFENLCRANRAHHVCPLCKQEDLDKDKNFITCDYCGKKYPIALSRLEKTKYHFCSRECKDNAQSLSSGEKFQDLRPEHYGMAEGVYSYRNKAFRNYPHKCSVCGWDEDVDVLEVHHINEDRSDNSLDNLIILCPICHRKLTNHKYELVDRSTIIKKE